MKNLIKQARLKNNLLVKDIAQKLNVDASLVSKWEAGTRKPTREQVLQIASVLKLDATKLLVEWMSEAIIYEVGNDELAHQAMILAEAKVAYNLSKSKKNIASLSIPKNLKSIIKEIDTYQKQLIKLRAYDSYRIVQALELEYTFDSNRIEGNTLTLKETDLVINEGITISGKTVREHLEAINHREAVEFLKYLVDKNTDLTESIILQLHNLVLRGIDSNNAGKYRKVQVMIKGSSHLPPQPFMIAKLMEDMMTWYLLNKNTLHPVLLAAELSERFVTIHPFIDGNGRTSRLLMNLILLQHGYVIANIKGDNATRLTYYNALEAVQVNKSKNEFLMFIANVELSCIKRYIDVLGGVA